MFSLTICLRLGHLLRARSSRPFDEVFTGHKKGHACLGASSRSMKVFFTTISRSWPKPGNEHVSKLSPSRRMAFAREAKRLRPLVDLQANPFGSGSKIGTQRTLLHGNMDQNLWSPSGLILTHTHFKKEELGDLFCFRSFHFKGEVSYVHA